MKLFDDFEAVRFPEENLIFVCHDGYLYYIYNPERKYWRKHRNAGNDHAGGQPSGPGSLSDGRGHAVSL